MFNLKKENFFVLAILVIAVPAFADINKKSTSAPDADNTAINQRDADASTLTPIDQAKGSKRDVELTRRIRQLIVKDKNLSSNATNVKVITLNGITTLRGPVNSEDERSKIHNFAAKIVGTNSVINQLEVTKQQ